MDDVKGVVYIIDDEDFIISQFPCEFDYAVKEYMGQRDYKGNRYHVALFGKPIPYKERPKTYATVRPQSGNSEVSTDLPIRY